MKISIYHEEHSRFLLIVALLVPKIYTHHVGASDICSMVLPRQVVTTRAFQYPHVVWHMLCRPWKKLFPWRWNVEHYSSTHLDRWLEDVPQI